MFDGSAFNGILFVFYSMAIALVFTIPLGLWKLFEVVMWVIGNVEIGIN